MARKTIGRTGMHHGEGSATSVNALKHPTTEAEGLYVSLIVYGRESEATSSNCILEAF